MNKPLIVRPEAEADLTEAYKWYENQVSGLGGDFLLCVDASFWVIQRNPKLYSVVYKGIVRRALTRRFPYGIYFIEGERFISVIGVVHAKRDSQVWQDRVV